MFVVLPVLVLELFKQFESIYYLKKKMIQMFTIHSMIFQGKMISSADDLVFHDSITRICIIIIINLHKTESVFSFDLLTN